MFARTASPTASLEDWFGLPLDATALAWSMDKRPRPGKATHLVGIDRPGFLLGLLDLQVDVLGRIGVDAINGGVLPDQSLERLACILGAGDYTGCGVG